MTSLISERNSMELAIAAAGAWNFDDLKRYLFAKGFPLHEVAQGIVEYRRFMTLIATGTACVPSKLLDEIWHAHILHSRDYIAFCRSLGKEYIHHDPATSGQEEILDEAYHLTLERYESLFRAKPDPTVWATSHKHHCAGHDCRGTCSHNCQAN